MTQFDTKNLTGPLIIKHSVSSIVNKMRFSIKSSVTFYASNFDRDARDKWLPFRTHIWIRSSLRLFWIQTQLLEEKDNAFLILTKI